MTITTAWQGELAARSFTFGRGTSYPGIGGIVGAYGTPTPEATDLRLTGRDGTVGGIDRYPKRVLRIPMQVLGDDGAGVDTNLAALKAAWRRSDTDLALSLRLAGTTTLTYWGGPVGSTTRGSGRSKPAPRSSRPRSTVSTRSPTATPSPLVPTPRPRSR